MFSGEVLARSVRSPTGRHEAGKHVFRRRTEKEE